VRVLVTGASGFIGAAVVAALTGRGHHVVAVARRAPAVADQGISWVEADLRTHSAWTALLDGITTIYHFAWSSLPADSNQDPVADAYDNIVGTLRLLEAARARSGIRFVFSSSGGTVYGRLQADRAAETHPTRPICAYGVSKLTVENYLMLYSSMWGLDAVTLRISNAYGPGQDTGRNFGAVTTFTRCALTGEPITIYGDGSVVRDYLYISDLVDAVVRAGQMHGGAAVLNIGSGVGHSLNEVVQTISRALGRPVRIRYLPARSFDVPLSVLDINCAQQALSWSPMVDIEQGVAATLSALRQNIQREGADGLTRMISSASL
jgi:UDP-glucose 4-epimerase